jgi:tRNA (guanine9-N1)-methyltransferase
MSKNAIKKAAKAARIAALKLERRAREKEAKKEKKRIRAEKRAAGDEDDEEEIKRRMKRPKLQFGGIVVVDLGFDSMMNDKVGSVSSDLPKCDFSFFLFF